MIGCLTTWRYFPRLRLAHMSACRRRRRAVASHAIAGPHCGLQTTSDLAQRDITHRVAETLVDRFELVDVHQEHCDFAEIPPQVLDLVRHACCRPRRFITSVSGSMSVSR